VALRQIIAVLTPILLQIILPVVHPLPSRITSITHLLQIMNIQEILIFLQLASP
jgi:hypothetical protein